MLSFWRSGDRPLGLGLMTGPFSRVQVLDAVEHAYRNGVLRAGEDRVVHIRNPSPPDCIMVSDLAEVQARVAELERRYGAGTRYKAVFVCHPAQTAITLEIYAALWAAHGDFTPEFLQVRTLATAAAILGKPRLARDFADRV